MTQRTETETRELTTHWTALRELHLSPPRPANLDEWRRGALDGLRTYLGRQYSHAAACVVLDAVLRDIETEVER